MNSATQLSRSDKLLLFLYEAGKGKSAKVKYEDIVVGVFKKYPHDFHLKGYPEYPDSGEMHKRLYDAKKKGYLTAATKIFALTDSGIEYAQRLIRSASGAESSVRDRLSRSAGVELLRIKGLEGFHLFLNGEAKKLTDNDLYDYLGVTIRTEKNSVIGRLRTLEEVCEELEGQSDQIAAKITEYHRMLMKEKGEVLSSIIT